MIAAHRWSLLAFLMFLAHLAGCATVMNPGPDKVLFKSEPSGASVNVDNLPIGKTPVSANVARTARYATFTLAGYEETQIPISRKMNPWVTGDALTGVVGVGGAMADTSNSNAQEANSEMDVHLHRSRASAAQPAPSPSPSANSP